MSSALRFDGFRSPSPARKRSASARSEARRQVVYELVSGLSGLALAVFMWGHMLLVGSILLGTTGFDTLAKGLEDYVLAQPTILAISALFVIHAAMASRKIPGQLRDRRRLRQVARDLRARGVPTPRRDPRTHPHTESMLWIWQVRTGMVVLVLGSFHLVLMGLDVFTPLFGERVGIEAVSSVARVSGGLWMLYGVLLLCTEFHAGVGLYRLAVKWGAGARLSRRALRASERVVFWVFLGIGSVTLAVLAGWLDPPLAFLLEADGG